MRDFHLLLLLSTQTYKTNDTALARHLHINISIPNFLITCLMHLNPVFINKLKLSLCLANAALRHEDGWRSGCIEPRFLDLGIS
jgi:hypothetical protein